MLVLNFELLGTAFFLRDEKGDADDRLLVCWHVLHWPAVELWLYHAISFSDSHMSSCSETLYFILYLTGGVVMF